MGQTGNCTFDGNQNGLTGELADESDSCGLRRGRQRIVMMVTLQKAEVVGMRAMPR